MDQNRNQGQRQGDEQSGPRRERNRGEDITNRGEGITNRGMDREIDEQSQLPERGSSETDRRESER